MKKWHLASIVAVVVVFAFLIFRLFLFPVPQVTPTPFIQKPAATSGTAPAATLVTATSTSQTTMKLANGHTVSLTHPSDVSINVAAQGFKHVRFMAWSPDHRLFVGEMGSADDTLIGHVYVLDDFDAASGTFKKATPYLSNLRNPNSVAFYTDPNGQAWIYVALTDKLVRYSYSNGDLKPSGAPQIIATFPDYGRPWTAGGWHLTRTLAFDGSKLFVSVGSSCNSCEEKASEPQRGTILEMNADGSDQVVYANGLRNAVGISVSNGELYATENGPDHLGPGKPNDTFFQIRQGTNYGWPWCYESDGKMYPDTTQAWQHPIDCSTVPLANFEFDPHSAPLGFASFEGSFLVALHGSGQKAIGNGYKVVALTPKPDGSFTSTDYLTGFLTNGTVTARPVDILPRDATSFFLTDDFNGAIYFVKEK